MTSPPALRRTLALLSLTAASLQPVQAQQISNTAQLRVGAVQIPSNTVNLTLTQTCRPLVTPDGTPDAPGQTVTLRAPGVALLPYRVTQNGTQPTRIDLTATADGPGELEVRVQDSAQPGAQALPSLILQPGESRDVLVAVRAPQALSGAARVNLAATCDGGQDPVNTSLVTLQPDLALLLTHVATPEYAEIGDHVTFTLTLPNPDAQPISPTYRVTLPPGVTYLPGSAAQGTATVPTTVSSDGRQLTLKPDEAVGIGATTTVTYQGILGPAAVQGRTMLLPALASASLGGVDTDSPVATARVLVNPGVFDPRATLIGTVYRDLNGSGVRDDAEPGVPGARVLLSNGTQVLTDARGEYTFRQLLPGPWRVQLDPAGLPGLGAPLAQLVDVAGLTRVDFPLPATPAPTAAPPEETTAPEGTGLIRAPLDGTLAQGERVNVTLQGPASEPLTLLVNGEPIPDTLIGEAGQNSDEQRVRYIGVPLQPGENTIEARSAQGTQRVTVTRPGPAATLTVTISPDSVADGRTPITLILRSLDAQGRPTGQEVATLDASAEPLDPDADPRTPGYQVRLRAGEARVRLAPVTSAATLTVTARIGELRTVTPVRVPQATRSVATAQGSVGVQLSGSELHLTGEVRAYAEQSIAGGELQVAIDSTGLPSPASAAQIPTRYPVVGSGTEARSPLSGDRGFAFRYDRADLSFGYYDAPLNLAPLTGLPRATALRGRVSGSGWSAQAFVGRVPTGQVTETFNPDGGRTYRLREPARPGTETVVVRGADDLTLQPGRDYVIDPLTGTVTLARGLTLYGPNFEPQTLHVTYLPAASEGRALAYGAGLSVTQGPWSADAAAAHVDGDTQYGAQVTYRDDTLTARAGYVRDPQHQGGQFSAEAHYRSGPLTANAALRVDPTAGSVSGTADLTYQSPTFRTRLAHQLVSGVQRTRLTVDTTLTPHLAVGGGLELAWPGPAQDHFGVNAVALLRYLNGPLSAELSHAQPLTGGGHAQTRLDTTFTLSEDTSVRARLNQDWGTGLTGELSVQQQLGSANLDVTYQLPSASGEGARARLGLSAPISLSDDLSGTISAAVTRDLTSGQLTAGATFGLRYVQPDWVATLGVDGSTAQGGTLILRGGATGTHGEHTFGVDARVQLLPTLTPTLSVSHAWRGQSAALIQTHRLAPSVTGDLTLAGEVTLNAQWSGAARLDLRPSVAYRWILPRPADSAVQVGLGVGAALTDRFGIGLNAYLLSQPGQGRTAGAVGGEVRYLLTDGVRVVAGYTFSNAAADAVLTSGARPGAFVRLDLTGGY